MSSLFLFNFHLEINNKFERLINFLNSFDRWIKKVEETTWTEGQIIQKQMRMEGLPWSYKFDEEILNHKIIVRGIE